MSTFVKLMNETIKRIYPSEKEIKRIGTLQKKFLNKIKPSSNKMPVNEFKKVKGILMVKIKDHTLSNAVTDDWISVRRAVEILYDTHGKLISRTRIRKSIIEGNMGLIAPIKL